MVEERLQTVQPIWTAKPNRQYIWGIRGPNDLVARERDTNGDGRLDEQLYALQDDNANVTTLFEWFIGSPRVVERMRYDAYGQPQFLNGSVSQQSHHDWNYLFGGYEYDATTGLYLVRRRVYHPTLGRWLQTDPVGYQAGRLRHNRQSAIILAKTIANGWRE